MEACEVGARDSEETGTLRVLMVDDDDVFRSLCARYLESAGGQFEVLFAESSASAEIVYALGDIDCVLLDYRLPDATGLEVFAVLQPEPDPTVPIIMLTGMSSEQLVIESLHAGMADFLPKDDVNAQTLQRAILNAVDRARLHRALVERNIQLEHANIVLSERNDQIRHFCHVMSHEMKTPLTAAREFVSLVLDGVVGEATPKQKEMLSMAVDSCDELAGHFNDLIESVRVDTGKLELHTSRLQIVDQIVRCVSSVSPIAQRKNIVIGQKIEDDLPRLDIDAGRIRQVISNLLTNALKFTDDGGLVTISASIDDDAQHLRVAVSDTGCGIDEGALPLVFERLYQVSNEAVPKATTGLGLGLSISRDIVDRHGGNISIDSKLGSGTTVSFRLPIPEDEQHLDSPVAVSAAR